MSTIDSEIDDMMSKWWIVDHRLHKRKDNNKQARRLGGCGITQIEIKIQMVSVSPFLF